MWCQCVSWGVFHPLTLTIAFSLASCVTPRTDFASIGGERIHAKIVLESIRTSRPAKPDEQPLSIPHPQPLSLPVSLAFYLATDFLVKRETERFSSGFEYREVFEQNGNTRGIAAIVSIGFVPVIDARGVDVVAVKTCSSRDRQTLGLPVFQFIPPQGASSRSAAIAEFARLSQQGLCCSVTESNATSTFNLHGDAIEKFICESIERQAKNQENSNMAGFDGFAVSWIAAAIIDDATVDDFKTIQALYWRVEGSHPLLI